MSSPWSKINPVESVSLLDIMSEEVAKDLQAKEDKKLSDFLNVSKSSAEIPEVFDECAEGTCNSDAVIAEMLQRQFDQEYDDMLKRTEDKFNGASKVSITLSNYRRTPLNLDFDSSESDEEVEDIRDRKDWDRFDKLKRDLSVIPACGYKVKEDGEIITKHDVTLNARKNACKFMSFPPEFQTGDGAGFDLQLSNKVFNSLKAHSKQEQARRHRINDKKEDLATAEFGVDYCTRLQLYKMINKQLLEKVNGVISTGKEAVILHADCDQNYPDAQLPKECVIKVFKTTLTDFKHRETYIKNDFRFKERIGKQKLRKTIPIWAEKEMVNLVRLRKAGILCPDVITLKKHILVMSFIGDNHKPAPKLKDAIMKYEDYIDAYDQVVKIMKSMYNDANLIHADFSEYNILWHNSQCYVIDVGQSMEPAHIDTFQFLMRDCENITRFFSKKQVPDMPTSLQLFEDITGYNFNDKVSLLALQESFKLKPHLMGVVDVHDSFDNAWHKFNSKEEETEDAE